MKGDVLQHATTVLFLARFFPLRCHDNPRVSEFRKEGPGKFWVQIKNGSNYGSKEGQNLKWDRGGRPTRSRGEPAVRSCCVLCWVYWVLLCSAVATGTVVVKGVSREQQVWILDLVSVLI